jgi:ribosomal protein L37AE/L43A
MTDLAIERLWEQAEDYKRDELLALAVYVCPSCGSDTSPPDELGCKICPRCGTSDCDG